MLGHQSAKELPSKELTKFNQLPQWVTWGLAFPLIILNAWLVLVVFDYFQSLITILVTATLLAFILDYPVQFLVSRRVQRSYAVLGVIFVAFLLLSVLGVTLAPIIFKQFNDLAVRLPSWIESGGQQLQSLNDWAIARGLPINLSGITTQLTERLSGQLRLLTGQALGLALNTVNRVVDLLLTLVLTFYLLLNGEQLWEGIFEWLPTPMGLRVRPLLRQNFHNYYVGQASLAVIIGVSLVLAFWLLRVPFGLLFGLGIGFMALFPFGASFSIFLVSSLMALKSFWLGVRVLAVAIVLGQVIENGIAPRLLGGFTGLNPVWILVSLLLGAKVGGVVGLLIAVPLASFIKNAAIVLRTAAANPVLDVNKVAQQQ
ncbi:MAG: AI-2E family transporter [Cyanophyceae cyanobacterium]